MGIDKIRDKVFIYIIVVLIAVSCDSRTKPPLMTTDMDNENLLSTLDHPSFAWMNKPAVFAWENQVLKVKAEEATDFFNNPVDGSKIATAPFLYQMVEGNFIAKTLVRPDFSAQWNAVSLMVYLDSLNWIKFAFEESDATGRSIVSVVTRDVSDDANGVILADQDAVWLKIIRQNDNYAMHWSLDDRKYHMARLTAMPPADMVKVGIEAQCPAGSSATHEIHFFGIMDKTVKDLRTGE